MPNIEHSFKALADSTRREIVYMLAVTPSGLSMREISDQFPASRQGVAKHLGVLEKAGLIQIQSAGREKKCLLNPLPLREVMDWLNFFKSYWEDRLNELKAHGESD
jgi:predicted transcriptional regulator